MKTLAKPMTHAALNPLLGAEFDNFLFASIGEDRNGTSLSVVSTLARLNVDPWQEAASLARMSTQGATERLTSLMAGSSKDLVTGVSPELIAIRLVALLPRTASFKVPAAEALRKAAASQPSRLLIALSVFGLLLAAYVIFAASHSPTPRAGASPSVTTGESAPR